MKKKIAVTLTTINMPKLLEEFASMALSARDEYEIVFIIIGDVKTPNGIGNYLEEIKSKYSFNYVYYDVDAQEKRFKKYSRLWNHIPLNSFARRNFADLHAYEEEYQVIIRIDDDNFPYDQRFFHSHAEIDKVLNLRTISSKSGWFNICSVLSERDNKVFYPRGFPFEQRWLSEDINVVYEENRAVLNAGFWLGDPDVDAVTRLNGGVDAISFDDKKFGNRFFLSKGTWSPINTQNTSYARELIPASFVSPFAGRYDDIIAGYFLRKIIDHLGDHVTYGAPLLKQVRNPHNLWSDFDKERIGGEHIGDLCNYIIDAELTNSDYVSCYGELVDKVSLSFNSKREFFSPIFHGMKIWHEVFSNNY